MARALVIKNANFATNRVAVIDIESSVDCTGIELAQSSITITSDEEVTVAYTVTPENTTDEVLWSSSDESVATVDGNVITILGIGSTTITATCGAFSDTLTLTADLYAAPDWFGASGTTAIITDGADHSIARLNGKADLGSSRMTAAQSPANSNFDIPLFDGNNIIIAYPIAIPNNAGKIHISASQGLYNGSNAIIFMDAYESVTYAAGTATSCNAISQDAVTASSNKLEADVTIPAGANSFTLDARLNSSAATGRTPDQAAEYCEFSIHFLPASESE